MEGINIILADSGERREACFPPNVSATDLKVGDRVQLTDKRPPWWDADGLMDKYLGHIVTIREISGGAFRACGSGNGQWLFSTSDIVRKVSSAHWTLVQPADLEDSGDRREFGTGAVRDMAQGKGRYDLLPWEAIHEVAVHCEQGALKYGERNCERGIPIHSLIDSALRHLSLYMQGQDDEPHLRAAAWNILFALWTERRQPEMQDIPARAE